MEEGAQEALEEEDLDYSGPSKTVLDGVDKWKDCELFVWPQSDGLGPLDQPSGPLGALSRSRSGRGILRQTASKQ